MATPYEHEISFSWPGLDPASAANSPRMKEILDFIGESDKEYQERLEKMGFAEKSAAHEKRHHFPLRPPHRRFLDFTRIIPPPPPEPDTPEDDDDPWIAHYKEEIDLSDVEDYVPREWLMANWGCYTNAEIEYVNWSPKHRVLTFETYGGNVTQVIAALHRQFPDVTILYNWRGEGDWVKGGCEFLARDDWDENAISARDAWLIERGMKQKGEMPKLEWEAGKPYNEWRMQI